MTEMNRQCVLVKRPVARSRREADVQRGFENVPATLIRVHTGENFGKQLLEL